LPLARRSGATAGADAKLDGRPRTRGARERGGDEGSSARRCVIGPRLAPRRKAVILAEAAAGLGAHATYDAVVIDDWAERGPMDCGKFCARGNQ